MVGMMKRIQPVALIGAALLLLTSCGGQLRERLKERAGDGIAAASSAAVSSVPAASEEAEPSSSRQADSPLSQTSSAGLPQASEGKQSDAQDEALSQLEDTLSGMGELTSGLDDVQDGDLVIPNPS